MSYAAIHGTAVSVYPWVCAHTQQRRLPGTVARSPTQDPIRLLSRGWVDLDIRLEQEYFVHLLLIAVRLMTATLISVFSTEVH